MHSKNHALTGLMAALAFVALAGAEPLQREARAEPAPAATPTGATPAPAAPDAKAKGKKSHEENGIVALVNDLPITSYELKQRMNLVFVTTKVPDNPEIKKKIREQVIEQLETEILQRQEAQKNDITISAVEVDKYMQGILDDNHMTKEQLTEVLAKGGVNIATFRAQLAAQILWQKAVQEHYAGRVNISPEAVDAEMARIREGINKAHFSVSEIFLAVDNPDLDEKVKKKVEDLATQIKGGSPFAEVARQFSQSPSAAQGGDIGTVYDGQLAPELNTALTKMTTGEMSTPIRSIGGYYILALRQRFEPSNATIEDIQPAQRELPATVSLGRLLLRLPPKPAPDYLTKVNEIAKQIQMAVSQAPSGCELAQKIPASAPGVLYMPLGPTRVADLNAEARNALQKTEIGGAAEPFRSDAGIEIFVRCEQKIAKKIAFKIPTREQVENQLFSEQISALARRYQRDLRRNANIEVR
ncbi:peptidylprolyl isomerase [Rhizomicrobium electricum]|uniref:Parvulin-like PPIase n=1 Tax=Rhizomicrobium electricum TaxID=480070 RepID=A0ABN1EC96_9PROT|nr:peptidylprolyl isomerase [Rhizomicrobium electricum]NIJ48213.1 peptidyl-prolyl cis-trans isomerase SurA [Rhizomicrobium electricum]